MVSQTEFSLRPRPRGYHLVTDEILAQLPPLPRAGLLHLFLQHTSAALTINENADPDVRSDMASVFDRLIREREPYYAHTLEGDDAMPAHAKSTLAGVSLTIPITAGRISVCGRASTCASSAITAAHAGSSPRSLADRTHKHLSCYNPNKYRIDVFR